MVTMAAAFHQAHRGPLGACRSVTCLPRLAFALDNHLLDLGDSLARIQTFRAGASAIQNGVAPVEAERIFKLIKPFPGRLVTAVRQPAPRLQQHRRTQEAISVPPMAWAAGRAAETQDAFVIAVEPAAFV